MNRYWRNKFWNEYGVKVKTYKYWDLWSFSKFYVLIVYRNCYDGPIGTLLTDKVFFSPESILGLLNKRELENVK